MRGAMSSDNAVVQNQRSFQMMIPLYMGDNEASYPTYFNIYDENVRDEDTGEDKKETWVRICILTDNVGAAEFVFRIYDESKLDMRFYFSESKIAKEFSEIYVDELKNTMKNFTLRVGEITVGSVGEGLYNYSQCLFGKKYKTLFVQNNFACGFEFPFIADKLEDRRPFNANFRIGIAVEI